MTLTARDPRSIANPRLLHGHPLTRRLGFVAAAATFVMLLAMTIATAFTVRALLNSQSEQRFADMVDGATNSVLADLEGSFTELAALEAFIRTEGQLTTSNFQIFASTLNQRIGGSESIGFAPRVQSSEAASFIERMTQDGVDLTAFDTSTATADLFPVAYLFPPVEGLLEPGRNIVLDPRFGTTILESLDSRSPTATGAVTLQTNESSPPRIFIFQPVFGDPAPGKHPSEGPLMGYAFSVYRAADFLAGPLSRNSLDEVPLRVIDGAPGRAPELIFPELERDYAGSLASGWVQTDLDFAGRRWSLQFETPDQFGLNVAERNIWVIVLSAGLGLTLFATASMLSLLRSRSAARSDLDLIASQIRVIVGSAIEGIVVLDDRNRLLLANQSFADAFGLPDANSLAQKDWSAVRESAAVQFADRDRFFEQLGELSASPTAAVAAQDVRIESPAQKTLSMSSSPVSDAYGRYLGRLFVFRDVTAERSAEEAKTDFVSMVSHELRTPLTSIVGYVDLLLEEAGGELTAESKRLLEVVRRNGDRLAALVADILDLSRIDSARFDLEPTLVDVGALVSEIVESMAGQVREKKQTVMVEIDKDLPAIEVDRMRMGQVFTNLLSNAHRYTPAGGECRVRAWVDEDVLAVSVKDTGVGIRTEDQPRIFERFARIDRNSARQAGSTGLGLAITRAIVELHGGRIRVESTYGEGSEFTVELPLRVTSETRDAA